MSNADYGLTGLGGTHYAELVAINCTHLQLGHTMLKNFKEQIA